MTAISVPDRPPTLPELAAALVFFAAAFGLLGAEMMLAAAALCGCVRFGGAW